MKSLKEIAWDVDEPTYRADPALSYSTLSKFDREGPQVLLHLDEKLDTESLRFGSLVDCLITSPEEFKDRFVIADFPSMSDTIVRIIKRTFELYGDTCRSIDKVEDDKLFPIIVQEGHGANWKEATRLKDVREKGGDFYNVLSISQGKILLNNEEYADAINCKETLLTNPFTKNYFKVNPFDEEKETLFQLKFRSDTLTILPVRCMFDLIKVDHKNKIIYPYDLKTTGKSEEDFYKSVETFRYDIQATLYYQILKEQLNKDEYFKDFTLVPFQFIVINRKNLSPLIWVFPLANSKNGFINNNGDIFKGWERLIKEINFHRTTNQYIYRLEDYENNGVRMLTNFYERKC